tara:strand:+ start:345 stop:461 length:117 start_codon:yes stop_codon:yes gene_type:complete
MLIKKKKKEDAVSANKTEKKHKFLIEKKFLFKCELSKT